jgi:RND superfamily putative drug exporter
MAAAILVDATVVRMLLVPAIMHLTGNANWQLPQWLDRRLPQLHVEGRPEVFLALLDPDQSGGRRSEPAIAASG